MIVKLLTEHLLKFLSLKGGCRGSSESTHVKMPHCWKSHAVAHLSRDLLLLPFSFYRAVVINWYSVHLWCPFTQYIRKDRPE